MSNTQVRVVRLLIIVALLALWEFYARFISTSSLIAGPIDVAMAWWPKVMGEPRVRTAVGVTLVELAIAQTLPFKQQRRRVGRAFHLLLEQLVQACYWSILNCRLVPLDEYLLPLCFTQHRHARDLLLRVSGEFR